jgi:RHS repeat-associated protein
VGNYVNYTYDPNGNMARDDTRGNDLSGSLQGAGGIGGLLARSDNTQLLLTQNSTLATACYHSDGNGNVTCLIYTNQFIAAKYLYDPYGNILSMYGPLAGANLYRFSSKEYHPNSGLVYYLYRFYDPDLQRWLNRDPLTEQGFEAVLGEPPSEFHDLLKYGELIDGSSLYTYVGNNAIKRTDPDGREWWLLPFAIGAYGVEAACDACGNAAYNVQAAKYAWDAYFNALGKIEKNMEMIQMIGLRGRNKACGIGMPIISGNSAKLQKHAHWQFQATLVQVQSQTLRACENLCAVGSR